MSFCAPTSITSGRPYHVRACRGRVPTALADFEGEADLILSTRTGTTVVRGVGAAYADWACFHEKDVAHDGMEIRLWHIVVEADGGFTATTGVSTVSDWPLHRRPVSPD